MIIRQALCLALAGHVFASHLPELQECADDSASGLSLVHMASRPVYRSRAASALDEPRLEHTAFLEASLDKSRTDRVIEGGFENHIWRGPVESDMLIYAALVLLLCVALALTQPLPDSAGPTLSRSETAAPAGACEAAVLQKAGSTRNLGVFCFAVFCDFIAMWMIAPFLPGELQKRGVSVSVTGILFGVYNLVKFFLAWPSVLLVKRFGAWNTLLLSALLVAFPKLAFSMAGRISSGPAFASACFLLRCLTGLGSLLISTSTRAILVTDDPGNISKNMGLLGIAEGCGGWRRKQIGHRSPLGSECLCRREE
jgi:hypothetical protein